MALIYALRVDGDHAPVVEFLNSIGASGFGVRESAGDNLHCHYYIRIAKKEQALRKALLKAVPGLRGNGGYSLAAARDADAYEKYMCKGESEAEMPQVVWSHGFDADADRLKSLHDSYWNEREAQERRKRKLPTADAVLADCKRRTIQWDNRRAITEAYIREVAARNKPINLYAVKSAVNAIQVALCPTDEAIDELVNRALA